MNMRPSSQAHDRHLHLAAAPCSADMLNKAIGIALSFLRVGYD